MKFASLSLLALGAILPGWAAAELSGTVGPSTTREAKAAKKTCNITSYGAKTGATGDIGAALKAAWDACKTGGEILIPSGEWGMSTWQTLSGGSGVSINLEGTIYRTGTAGGHMIIVQKSTDVEFYSGNSKGAMQGYGYEFHKRKLSAFCIHVVAVLTKMQRARVSMGETDDSTTCVRAILTMILQTPSPALRFCHQLQRARHCSR